MIGKLLIYKNNYKFTQLRKFLKINLLYLQVRQAARHCKSWLDICDQRVKSTALLERIPWQHLITATKSVRKNWLKRRKKRKNSRKNPSAKRAMVMGLVQTISRTLWQRVLPQPFEACAMHLARVRFTVCECGNIHLSTDGSRNSSLHS